MQWAWPQEGHLQINLLGGPDSKQALLFKNARQMSILQLNFESSGGWSGEQHGDFPLWQRITNHYRTYQELGQPGKEAFQVRLEKKQAALFVSSSIEDLYLRDLFC